MTPQEQPDSQARDELYELIVSEVDSYAAPEYESYYPSIKENLMPKIEDYAERLATEARIDEHKYFNVSWNRIAELEATLTKGEKA